MIFGQVRRRTPLLYLALLALWLLSACGQVRVARAPPPPPPPPNPVTPVEVPKSIIVSLSSYAGARVLSNRDLIIEFGSGPNEAVVCGEDDVRIAANVQGAPNDAEYHWTVNGQPLAGGGSSLRLDQARRAGTYLVALRVSGPAGYADGHASTSITTLEDTRPSGTISANPSELEPGQKSALTVSTGPVRCGGPVTVSLAATEGKISGTTFETDGVEFENAEGREQHKSVTIIATFRTPRGVTATATTNIVIRKPPEAFHFTDILFGKNDTAVNFCGERALRERLPGVLAQHPGAQVLLGGHSTGDEARNTDRQRVAHVASLLSAHGVAGPGPGGRAPILIDSMGTSQTSELKSEPCGIENPNERAGDRVSSDREAAYRRVEMWIVPTGASVPAFASGARRVEVIVDGDDGAAPPGAGKAASKPAVEIAPEPAPQPPEPGVIPAPLPLPPVSGVVPTVISREQPQGTAALGWWQMVALVAALLLMLLGAWTAARAIGSAAWFSRARDRLVRRKHATVGERGGRVIVRDGAGYVVRAEIVTIHHFADQSRIDAFYAQLMAGTYHFKQIPPGFPEGTPSWRQQFLGMLEGADAILVVLTEAALGQQWLNWRIEKALRAQQERQAPIYVVALDQRVFDVAHTIGMLSGMKWYQASGEDHAQLMHLLMEVKPTVTRDVRCFISYSHLKPGLAAKIRTDLERASIYCWIDVEGLPGGVVWKKKIAEAIEASSHVLFMMTAESLQSDEVLAEIDWAKSKKKVVIPILEENVPLPFGLLGTQAINFAAGYDSGINRLLQALLETESEKTEALTGERREGHA